MSHGIPKCSTSVVGFNYFNRYSRVQVYRNLEQGFPDVTAHVRQLWTSKQEKN